MPCPEFAGRFTPCFCRSAASRLAPMAHFFRGTFPLEVNRRPWAAAHEAQDWMAGAAAPTLSEQLYPSRHASAEAQPPTLAEQHARTRLASTADLMKCWWRGASGESPAHARQAGHSGINPNKEGTASMIEASMWSRQEARKQGSSARKEARKASSETVRQPATLLLLL